MRELKVRSHTHASCVLQVARAQAVAGRLANQLAPSDTQPHQATADMADDRADDEQQGPVLADGAQIGKRLPAETAAKGREAADRLPSTKKRQPSQAMQKQVGFIARHIPHISDCMHALVRQILLALRSGDVLLQDILTVCIVNFC